MPVSDKLPYQWYDTPNIHLCTVADFDAFLHELATAWSKAAWCSQAAHRLRSCPISPVTSPSTASGGRERRRREACGTCRSLETQDDEPFRGANSVPPVAARRPRRAARVGVRRGRLREHRCHRPAAVVERRRHQGGDREARVRVHARRRRRLRAGAGAHRRVRQRRHAVDRAPALYRSGVHAGPHPGIGAGTPGVADEAAVQGGGRRRPSRDGQIHGGGLFRAHRCHACGNGTRSLPRHRGRLAGHCPAPALSPAVHGTRLPADARGSRLLSCPWLQDVHRLRRHHRLHARVRGARVRHSARTGRGHHAATRSTALPTRGQR